jgi:outer membrane protein assembly factor BamA
MRYRLAQFAIFYTASLLVGQRPIHAQQADANAVAQSESSCPSSFSSHDEQPSGPEIAIAEVSFWGPSVQMPTSEQDRIAASIKQLTHGNSLDEVVDEALETVREDWQDHGYFQVQVRGEAKTLSSSPVSQRIALSVHVEDGFQYSLRDIKFKHNKVITDAQALRTLFPIKDGDIFSRQKIATGLENLKNAYGTMGYANFTCIADTRVDDANRVISLDLDIDEGKKFFVRDISVLGLDESARQEVLQNLALKRGQVFNGNSYKVSLLQWLQDSKFPDCECGVSQPLHLDEQKGAADITLDFRPSPTE